MKEPLCVAVTGAAGQLAYALLFRLISGEAFGEDQPLQLKLLELPEAMRALEGVAMELVDTASPLLASVDLTDDPARCFRGAQEIFLIGAQPRTKGMKRADLLSANGPIFRQQGQAIAREASQDVRVVVIGNPANTNCLVAMANAPEVPAQRWSAMTRLDQNRAAALFARKAGVSPAEVRIAVWGNHSASQFPDFTTATCARRPALEVIGDHTWFTSEFLPAVRNRGAEIIAARGRSSAASAAAAAVDHVRDRLRGVSWTSMAVRSSGQYDVPEGLVFSFPVRCPGADDWEIIEGLKLNEFARAELQRNVRELKEEARAVRDLLPQGKRAF